MGNRQGLDQVQADKYLSAGYTIIAIDYRLAPQAKLPQIMEGEALGEIVDALVAEHQAAQLAAEDAG